MTKNLIKCGTAAVAGLLLAANAQAGSFQGTTSGIFLNPTGPGVPDHVTGVGTDTFTWGSTASSSLHFAGTSFDTDPGVVFGLGDLTYANATSAIGTGAESVDLAVTLTFSVPSIPGEDFTYTFNLVNTVNNNDADASADIIEIPQSKVTTIFAGGQSYTLEVFFGDISGDGFLDDQGRFHVREGGTATVELNGLITVPDGGLTIALLGAALGGVGFVSRRMKF
jgi:hypothetical protein